MKPIYLTTLVGLAILVSGLYLPYELNNYYQALQEVPEKPKSLPEASQVLEMTIEEKIYAKATEYGLDGDLLLMVALCESSLDPNAENHSSTAKGLYQITYDTWMDGIKRRGLYWEWDNVFDENKNIDMAAWWISKGYLHKWSSSEWCWSN